MCVVESALSEDAVLEDSSNGPSSVPLTVTEEELCKLYKQLDDKVGIVWTHPNCAFSHWERKMI